MKIKATDFRAVCYGIGAVCTGIAALYQTGMLDKAIEGGKNIANKFKKEDKKSEVKIEQNPVIKEAVNNVYYSECFRHGGYRN